MRYAFLISSTGDTNLAIKTIGAIKIQDPSSQIIIIPLTDFAAKYSGLSIFSARKSIRIMPITEILQLTAFKKSLSEEEQQSVFTYLKGRNIARAFIGVSSALDEKTPYELADCFIKNPNDAIPHIIAYEHTFKAPAEHPVWLLKPDKNRSVAIPIDSAKDDFPDFNTHVVSHISFTEALKAQETNAKKFLNKIFLGVPSENELVFISGTREPMDVDTQFLDALLKEMCTGNYPNIAIRFGLHPDVKDIDIYLEKLLSIVDQYPQTHTAFKIILTDEMSNKIKNTSLKKHLVILKVNISGDDAAMVAKKVGQAVPGDLVNTAALMGKKVFLDPAAQTYLGSENFVTSIPDLLTTPPAPTNTDKHLKTRLMLLGSPANNMARLILNIKEKNNIVNLSDLIHTKKTTALIPSVLGHIYPAIQNEWPSILAFFDLYNRFMKYRFLNFSKFFTKTYNLALLAENFLKCRDIQRYKKGDISTNTFLQFLLDKEFYFLKQIDLKKDADVVKEIAARKKTLLTTYDLTETELLDNTILAKALLEIAWIARMTFHNETNAYFDSFIQDKHHHYILISNSNPMDIWQTVLYLKSQFPVLCWNSDESLYHQINNNYEQSPIELTSNKRLLLYPSYRYGLLKTEGLLEEITKTFPNTDFKLVSQSKCDLAMAEKLNISHQEAEAYFDVDGTRRITSQPLA